MLKKLTRSCHGPIYIHSAVHASTESVFSSRFIIDTHYWLTSGAPEVLTLYFGASHESHGPMVASAQCVYR